MRITVYAMILLLAAGCGRNGNQFQPIQVDSEAEAIISELEEELGIDFPELSVYVKKFPPSADRIGFCSSRGYITLSKDFVAEGGIQVKALVLHELGHCAYGLDHTTEVRPDGCAQSVMFAYNQDACLSYYWEDYKTEFVERIGKVAE